MAEILHEASLKKNKWRPSLKPLTTRTIPTSDLHTRRTPITQRPTSKQEQQKQCQAQHPPANPMLHRTSAMTPLRLTRTNGNTTNTGTTRRNTKPTGASTATAPTASSRDATKGSASATPLDRHKAPAPNQNRSTNPSSSSDKPTGIPTAASPPARWWKDPPQGPPHPRGSTVLPHATAGSPAGSPTPEGIHPTAGRLSTGMMRFPHTRGIHQVHHRVGSERDQLPHKRGDPPFGGGDPIAEPHGFPHPEGIHRYPTTLC